MELGGQRTLVACGEVRCDVFRIAHAGNRSVHVEVVQDEPQGHFGQGHAVRQKRFEGTGSLHTGFEILRDEVSAAPITLRHVLLSVSVPVSEPSSKGTRAMTATSFSRHAGKSSSSGFWSKML